MDGLTANSISTFGGSPLAAAGGLANLRYLLQHDLQRNAARVGGWLISELQKQLGGIPPVGDVRGRGLMIGVELVVPGTNAPDASAADTVLESCRAAGLLVGKGGLHGNVIRIAPPLSLTREEAREGAEILCRAVRLAAGERDASP